MSPKGKKIATALFLALVGLLAADLFNGASLGFWSRVVLATASSRAGALLWDTLRE